MNELKKELDAIIQKRANKVINQYQQGIITLSELVYNLTKLDNVVNALRINLKD